MACSKTFERKFLHSLLDFMTFPFDLFFKFERVFIINRVQELVLNAVIRYGYLSLYDFDDILQRLGIILAKAAGRNLPLNE